MRPIGFCLAVLLTLAVPARAQIGKSVAVAAGTPEDAALSEIYAEKDAARRITLLDKFMADFGKGDLALLGDQLYASAYLEQKNYDKAFEYAEKALALDPDNLSSAISLVHAAEGQGDAAKLFDAGGRVSAILTRYKAAPPPPGAPPEEWERRKAENLGSAQADASYVEYALFNAAYQTRDPAAKAALLERFAGAFPNSSYRVRAEEEAAFAYQQTQNYPKMLSAAQKVLEADPDNVSMLVLLADYWSERGQELDKAVADAQKAIDVLGKAKRPEGVSDEQWQQRVSLQKGMAYSALGQVHVNKNRNAQAVEAFKQANPLLKSNPTLYGRNLYRLGFTLAKMRKIPEARSVLGQAVAIDSPYRSLAQQTLDKISGSSAQR
jgi:tetratricopeptide (TPR) repeat protein